VSNSPIVLSQGRSNPRDSSNSFAVVVSALLGGLAGGAAWCLLAPSLPWAGAFGIVPIAIALGVFAHWQGYPRRAAIVCAAFATGIAFVYARYLFGAVRIADAMGISLREALFKAGFDLTADIAWANVHGSDWVALLLALAVGSGTSMRSPRRHMNGSAAKRAG